ncbi:MAG: hypothetical protein K0M70_02985 [Arenimonas sp.]|uniref:hypothetical protein n=1 Tax=Arenimonas sp. TaxID=1872635 RepID=UPI0025C14828|nr:hypothetical protein [Arenimonas sp.]MBW8366807.1 hypothetical protein [Arenimonas sp.]
MHHNEAALRKLVMEWEVALKGERAAMRNFDGVSRSRDSLRRSLVQEQGMTPERATETENAIFAEASANYSIALDSRAKIDLEILKATNHEPAAMALAALLKREALERLAAGMLPAVTL